MKLVPKVWECEDKFDPESFFKCQANKDLKTLSLSKQSKEGGYGFVKWAINPDGKNIYNFVVTASVEMDIWVGIQWEEPQYEWWVNLRDGHIFESKEPSWKPFTDAEFQIGDLISLGVHNGIFSLFHNWKKVGDPFKSKLLRESENMYPSVYMTNKKDTVWVSDG